MHEDVMVRLLKIWRRASVVVDAFFHESPAEARLRDLREEAHMLMALGWIPSQTKGGQHWR